MALLIKGGLVVDPSQNINQIADLFIEAGKVRKPGQDLAIHQTEVIDAAGLVVIPGLIDLHVHLREPGREDAETIESGGRAAAAGGFTSVCCMPNTQPVNDCAAVTSFILSRARQTSPVNVWPVGAITKSSAGEVLADFAEMKQAGAVALSDDGRPVANAQLMRRAMQYAAQLRLPIIDHCQDDFLFAGGVMNEGVTSAMLGLPGIPESAEVAHIARDCLLAEETQAHVHIAHLSTAKGVRLIRENKSRGVPISCEVTPHHLLLTEDALGNFDPNLKMNPPLRSKVDVEALIEGLQDGTIDALATDHAPHHLDEKMTDMIRAPFGVIGLETAVPLLFDRLVRAQILDLPAFVRLLSCNPASIVGIDRGTLKIGANADITIIDPRRTITISAPKFYSKARNTPFQGWSAMGTVTHTIVGGRIAFKAETAEPR